MTTSRAWFITSSVAALLVFDESAMALQYKLSSQRIQPGERLTVEVRLKVEEPSGDVPLDPPDMKDDWITQSTTLTLLDRDVKREGEEWIWQYQITSHKPGKITIPPVEIRHGPQNYSTEATSVDVSTSRPETDEELRPEFGSMSARRPWMMWFAGALGLAALVTAAWYASRRWRKPRPKPSTSVIPVPVPVEDPRAWLTKQIALLKERLEKEGDKATVVDELTRVVREYFARKNGLPVETWTSAEFRRSLSGDAAAEKIHSVFVQCDLFKFSGTRALEAKALATSAVAESEKILLCGT